MRKILGWFALAVIVGIIFGCASDIILEEPPSLKGRYEGKYIVTINLGSVSEIEMEQNIIWRFTDREFFMYVDTPKVIREICFCTARGTYRLEERVHLQETSPAPIPDYPCQACDLDLKPDGSFTLEQPTEDSVKLSQMNVDTLREILLKRVPEVE
jgi:hypothetical protein